MTSSPRLSQGLDERGEAQWLSEDADVALCPGLLVCKMEIIRIPSLGQLRELNEVICDKCLAHWKTQNSIA